MQMTRNDYSPKRMAGKNLRTC